LFNSRLEHIFALTDSIYLSTTPNMAESNRRPSIISKRTHVRAQKHLATFPSDLPTPSRLFDSLVVGAGYAGLATYLYTRFNKFSPWEVVSVSVGSLALGYGIFDLGKRNGIIQGASFALRSSEDKANSGEREDWRGEFTGMEYEQLNDAEKITWLKKEEARIREMQEEEQLRCGKAYIAKEEAYIAYEKHGGYGGADWKRCVGYVSVKGSCADR
jgi:hypothetical protein